LLKTSGLRQSKKKSYEDVSNEKLIEKLKEIAPENP